MEFRMKKLLHISTPSSYLCVPTLLRSIFAKTSIPISFSLRRWMMINILFDPFIIKAAHSPHGNLHNLPRLRQQPDEHLSPICTPRWQEKKEKKRQGLSKSPMNFRHYVISVCSQLFAVWCQTFPSCPLTISSDILKEMRSNKTPTY